MTERGGVPDVTPLATKECSVVVEKLDASKTEGSTNTKNLTVLKTAVSPKLLSKSAVREKALGTFLSQQHVGKKSHEHKPAVKRKPCSSDSFSTSLTKKTKLGHKFPSNGSNLKTSSTNCSLSNKSVIQLSVENMPSSKNFVDLNHNLKISEAKLRLPHEECEPLSKSKKNHGIHVSKQSSSPVSGNSNISEKLKPCKSRAHVTVENMPSSKSSDDLNHNLKISEAKLRLPHEECEPLSKSKKNHGIHVSKRSSSPVSGNSNISEKLKPCKSQAHVTVENMPSSKSSDDLNHNLKISEAKLRLPHEECEPLSKSKKNHGIHVSKRSSSPVSGNSNISEKLKPCKSQAHVTVENMPSSKSSDDLNHNLKISEANLFRLPHKECEPLSKSKKNHGIPVSKKNSSPVSESSNISEKLKPRKSQTHVTRISKKSRDDDDLGFPNDEHNSKDQCIAAVNKASNHVRASTKSSSSTNAKSDQCINTKLDESTNTESNQCTFTVSSATSSFQSVKHLDSIQDPSAGESSASCHNSCIKSSNSKEYETDNYTESNASTECANKAAEYDVELQEDALCVGLEPDDVLFDDSESEEEHSYKRLPKNKQQRVDGHDQTDICNNESSALSRCTADVSGSSSKISHIRKDLINEIPPTRGFRNALETSGHSRTDVDRSTYRKRPLSPGYEENVNQRTTRTKMDELHTYSRSKEAVPKDMRDTINVCPIDNRNRCFAYMKTGMCDRDKCKFRHCPPGYLKNGEFVATTITGYYSWRHYVHDGNFLPMLQEFCKTGRLNLAFKHVHDHIAEESCEAQSKAVLLLLSTSISMKAESFVPCVTDFINSNLLTINFCSDFITVCCEDPNVSFSACQSIFSLCEKRKIPLKEDAARKLLEIFEHVGSDWSQMLSVMTYINLVCKEMVPVNIFEKTLRAVSEIKKQDLVLKMNSLVLNLDEDYICRIDPVHLRIFKESVKAVQYSSEICSTDQPLNHMLNVNKKAGRELIRNYVAQDRWIKVVEHFQNAVNEGMSGYVVEVIHDAIFSHGELLGGKYYKFIREVSGFRELNLFQKSLLGQLGVVLVLEAHNNGLMKAAFEVLEAMHTYGINYMELQPSVIPETIKNAVDICVTYSWVALVVADVCVQADELGDAVHFLKDTSWATPSEKLNFAVRNHELSFRIRLLIKLSSALLKKDECELGVEVMDVLLTSVTNDFKGEIYSSITKEIDELYSSYLVNLLNKRLPAPCITLYKHMSDLHCIVRVKPLILRSLIILWYPSHFRYAEELFYQAVLRGLYPFDLPEQLVERQALTLPTCLSKAEFFLIFQLYVDKVFMRLRKTELLSGSIQFPSISIILKEQSVEEKEPFLTQVHELNCDLFHARKRFIKEFKKLFQEVYVTQHYSKDILHFTEDAVSSMFLKWKETQMSSQSVDRGISNFPTTFNFETSSAFFGNKYVPNSKQDTAFQKDVDAPLHSADPKFPTPPSSLAAISRSSSLSSEKDIRGAQFQNANGKPLVFPSSPVHHSPFSSTVEGDLFRKPEILDNDECSESSLQPECEFSNVSSSPKNIIGTEESGSSRPTSTHNSCGDEESTSCSCSAEDSQSSCSAEAYSPKSDSSNKSQLCGDFQNSGSSSVHSSNKSHVHGDFRNCGSSTVDSNRGVESAIFEAGENSKDSDPMFYLISTSGPINSTSNKMRKLNRPDVLNSSRGLIESSKPPVIAELKRSVTHTVNSAEAARTNRLRDVAVGCEKKYGDPLLHHRATPLLESCESGSGSNAAREKIVQFLKTKILLKHKVQPLELESRASCLCRLFLNSEENGQITKLCKSTMKRLEEFSQKHI